MKRKQELATLSEKKGVKNLSTVNAALMTTLDTR